MHLTGQPDGEPQKMGVAFVDVFTGLYAVVAIQSALLERARSGEGQHIDAALLDSQVGVLANQALNYLVSGVTPKRMGNAHPNIVPYQVFPVADGHVVIAVGNEGQFQRLCGALGAKDLAADPRFQSNAGRVAHRAEVVGALTRKLLQIKRDTLLAELEKVGVPAGPILDPAEVFANPQVVARGMRIDLPTPDAKGGRVPGVRTPILFSRTPLTYEHPSPRLGADTEEVLAAMSAGRPVFRSSG
jgi:crotonobetainyl-CoA:carnitine CoA-transferase CaiB-like acyl-CoA transferase